MPQTIYGYEVEVTNKVLCYAQLVVRILQGWPDKTPYLKQLLDVRGGGFLFTNWKCSQEKLCLLCVACRPEEDRENVHRFLDAFQSRMNHLPYAFKMELVKFVNAHRSLLLDKKATLRELPLFPVKSFD